MDLHVSVACALIRQAVDDETESFAWDAWSKLLPFMSSGFMPFVPYEEFRAKEARDRTSTKNRDDVMDEMMKVVKSHEKGGA